MGSDLVFAPFSQESDITMKTSHICPSCAEPIVFTEEVVLLQVVQPHVVNGALVLSPILSPVEDAEGSAMMGIEGENLYDFLYEPYFIQLSPCWDDIEQWLVDELEDQPPVEDAYCPVNCRYCNSGIREWEFCGSLTVGEFHASKRQPIPGVREEAFIESGEPGIICLYCLYLINEGNLEFWDAETGGVSQDGECADCLQARCFRWLPGSCDCPCHVEEMTDE